MLVQLVKWTLLVKSDIVQGTYDDRGITWKMVEYPVIHLVKHKYVLYPPVLSSQMI
jgi:hypothetical protein